jgi:hypothetical protein
MKAQIARETAQMCRNFGDILLTLKSNFTRKLWSIERRTILIVITTTDNFFPTTVK